MVPSFQSYPPKRLIIAVITALCNLVSNDKYKSLTYKEFNDVSKALKPKNRQKTFVTLSEFWPLSELGFVMKITFYIMFNEVLKSCKN